MKRFGRGLLVAFLCVLVAGCGESEDDRPPPGRMLSRALERTLDMGGATIDYRTRSDDRSLTIRRQGNIRLDLEKAHLIETFAAPGAARPLHSEIVYSLGWSYRRGPDSRRWLAARARLGVSDLFFRMPVGVTDLRYGDEEDLSGEETTRIEGWYDLRRLTERIAPEEREAWRRFIRPVEDPRLRLTAWIDERRRIRQWRLDGDLRLMGEQYGELSGSEVVRLTRFDPDIEIEIPPQHLVDRRPRRPGTRL
jgi:hypothetical protein